MIIDKIKKNKDVRLAAEVKVSQLEQQEYEFIPVWEVVSNFRCPLIGSCLTIEEQRKILKKTALLKKGGSEFDAHHMLMDYAGTENPVSHKADRYIRNKYKFAISDYKELREKELETLWREAKDSGEMAGLFYVIATRKDISMKMKMLAFGDIHMMGHSNMHDIMKARKALNLEKNVNEKTEARLNDEKNKNRELKALIKKHIKTISSLESSADSLSKQLEKKSDAVVKPETGEFHKLKVQLTSVMKKNEQLTKENQVTLREKRKLEIRYFDSESTCKILRGEILQLMKHDSAQRHELCERDCVPGTCPTCETCPKQILMIGGMTKMKPFYRDIVESNGNEFIYHDGYMKNKTRQLSDLVASSDLVLCPVNCNSHNACLRIKKLCKKHNKPYKMMPCSSLSAVSKAVAFDEIVQT